MDNFGERLSALRAERGLTRHDAAEGIRCTAGQLRYWETGVSNPTVQGLIDISRFYGVSLQWLIAGTGPKRLESIDRMFDPEAKDRRDDILGLVSFIPWDVWAEAFMLAVRKLADTWRVRDAAMAKLNDPRASEVEKAAADNALMMVKREFGVDPDDERAEALVREYRKIRPDDDFSDLGDGDVTPGQFFEMLFRPRATKPPAGGKGDRKRKA